MFRQHEAKSEEIKFASIKVKTLKEFRKGIEKLTGKEVIQSFGLISLLGSGAEVDTRDDTLLKLRSEDEDLKSEDGSIKDETKEKKKNEIQESMNESKNEDAKESKRIVETETLQMDSSLVVTLCSMCRFHM